MQNRYNLVNREDEREMIPLCVDQGVGLVPYSPLARGLLAGTRPRAGDRSTAPVIGATKPRHLADALAAISLVLDETDTRALEDSYAPHWIGGYT